MESDQARRWPELQHNAAGLLGEKAAPSVNKEMLQNANDSKLRSGRVELLADWQPHGRDSRHTTLERRRKIEGRFCSTKTRSRQPCHTCRKTPTKRGASSTASRLDQNQRQAIGPEFTGKTRRDNPTDCGRKTTEPPKPEGSEARPECCNSTSWIGPKGGAEGFD